MLTAGCAGDGSAPSSPRVAEPLSVPTPSPTAIPTAVATSVPGKGLQLLAHRGVHQTFDPEGVDDQTCTATRIDPPTHSHIENTIPSIEAAFAAGASVVEIDIAPTIDGVLAVFHDWEIGCRTNGSGEIRSLTWTELSKLDVGYGYTSDGESYPLRGQGEGLLPRLEQVFAAFPEAEFLINFKSNDESEATLLSEVVRHADAAGQVWAVYGGPAVVEAYLSATDARGFSEESIRTCLGEYLAAADGDIFPVACRDTVVAVPVDLAPILTGWPDAFTERMASHGTDVIISGPGLTGIDTRADLDLLPEGVELYVWTDQVEVLAG